MDSGADILNIINELNFIIVKSAKYPRIGLKVGWWWYSSISGVFHRIDGTLLSVYGTFM